MGKDYTRGVGKAIGEKISCPVTERRTSRIGRDTIDHAPGGHDDLANAVAGALVAVGKCLKSALGILLNQYIPAEVLTVSGTKDWSGQLIVSCRHPLLQFFQRQNFLTSGCTKTAGQVMS